ncbi:MAG: T9SS C-terminal target domain-containing protein, partial [Calditrichaeota bacterium]
AVSGNPDISVAVVGSRLEVVSSPDYFGVGDVTVTATDGGGLSASDTFQVQITPVNDAPVIIGIPEIIIPEDSSFCLDVDTVVIDVDDSLSRLQWEIAFVDSSLNDSIDIVFDTLAHVVCFVPDSNFTTVSRQVLFTVTDTSGARDQDTVLLSILPRNDPPVIGALPEIFFAEDDTLRYPVSAWYPFVNDPDDPDSALNFTVRSGAQVTAMVQDSLVRFYAPLNWFGRDTLRLIVSDGMLADSAALYVTVRPVNDPPVIAGLPDSILFRNDSSATLPVWAYVSDPETPDSLLSYQFPATNDSLIRTYDPAQGQLTLSAIFPFHGEVWLHVVVTDDSNAVAHDSLRVIVEPSTSVFPPETESIPETFVLQQNFPNPFNPTTRIRFGLPVSGRVRLEVFNILGQRVATLLNASRSPGYHVVEFHGEQLPSGVYFYRIEVTIHGTRRFQAVRRMLLVR